jgi:hypothetical protein
VGLWLAVVLLALGEVWIIVTTLDRPVDQWGPRGFEAAVSLAFGTVGALVAVRRPENLIGWMILVPAGVGTAAFGIVVQYPVLAAASAPPLSGGDLARWLAAWSWVVPAGGFMTLFPLVFPDGHLLSSRWRPAVVLSLAALATLIGEIIATSQPFGPVPPTNNPAPYFEAIGPAMAIGYGAYWIAAVVAVGSLVQRYRQARTEERQQIKWVAAALVVAAPAVVAGSTPIFLGQVAFVAAGFLAAAAIAVAIFRYRLYEIDLIINRTLVYGALTAILAGVYTASITLSTRLFSAVTGERSDAAVVLTTLIVVSVFTPLRTRLQAIVDRRIRTTASLEDAAILSSLEALDALGRLIRLNASGGLTAEEFGDKKAELLRRI